MSKSIRKITDKTDITFEGSFMKTEPIKAVRMDEPFEVETLEGVMKGKAGDWLAEGIQGERWPIDADIFSKTYRKKEASVLHMTPMDYVDIMIREHRGRPATPREIHGALAEPEVTFVDDGVWPRNQWVDALAHLLEVDMGVVLSLPAQHLSALRSLWDLYIQNEDDAVLDQFVERAAQALGDLQ